MSKVYLGVGHGGRDSGAVGYIVEKDVNLQMALACKEYLEQNGVEVKISRVDDSNKELTQRIKECNTYAPDLAIDIHNNAGGGDGFEVYHTLSGGTGKILAQNIEEEVKAIGQNSRGLKTKANSQGKDYFGFIRQITCPSIITETVFVDNQADASQADTLEEQKAFGQAIARGVLKTLGVVTNNTTTTVNTTVQNTVNTTGTIATIQSTLNTRYGLSIAVDNLFGTETKKALIKALQTELNTQYGKGLVVDGIFGTNTYNACVNVRQGARGNITYILQAILFCKGYNTNGVDGIFESGTASAVKQFQKDHGLSVDRIAGKNTFKALFA